MNKTTNQEKFELLFSIAGETLHTNGYQTLQSQLVISYKAMMDEFITVLKEIENKQAKQ